MSNIYEDLQKYFGYSSFLPYQEEIITDVVHKKDVLAVLATGGGKSICYQLPSVHMDGVTIVISPLKALMKDQVDTLTAHGIPAATINSSNYSEHRKIMDDARAGRLKLIYVSPERIVKESFMDFLCSLSLSLIAVDEAHCISMWGHNFRPEYRELQTIHKRFPRVPMVALTATAIPQVRDDIIMQLGLNEPAVYIGSFHRKNLHYAVRPKNKHTIREIISYLSAHPDDSGIIYCLSRKTTEEVAAELRQNGYNAQHFHASLPTAEKEEIQDKFTKNEIPVICATIAFGMGIDKPDVRFVIHYDLPKDLESYYQETGRAGRDGDPSDCILFYGRGDIVTRRMMIENDSYANPVQVKTAYHKLNDLINYAESPECRKTHLMRYFGEELSPENCSGCDICDTPSVSIDGKEMASTAYRCIQEMNGKFGISTIADMLAGSKSKRILSRNLDDYQSYSSGTGHSATAWKDCLYQLTAMGYFGVSDSEYPVISLTEKSPDIIHPDVQITLKKTVGSGKNKQKRNDQPVEESGDPKLFAALKQKRLELAREAKVPPFIIMHDKTLRAISLNQPLTEEEWAAIPGISLGKYQKYGEYFSEVILSYLADAETDMQERSEDSGISNPEDISTHTNETENPELLALLKEKRQELSIKEGFPDQIIVQDKTLQEISVCQPLTEEEWMAIQGVGAVRYQRYGKTFTEVIREYQADAGEGRLNECLTPENHETNVSRTVPDSEITRETPSPFATTIEEEIDWLDVYIDRMYPNGCSPVSNAQKTKELANQGQNPGEIAATTGISIRTITRHLLELTLSEELDAWEYVSPYISEQHFTEIAATLRAVTEEDVEGEVISHLKQFYSETEINIAVIGLIHDKQKCHTVPPIPKLTDIDRDSLYPTEFLPLLPDTTGIFPYDVLKDDLVDDEHSIRKRAARMLGYLGEPGAIPLLIMQLEKEEKDSVRAEIMNALTSLQDHDHPQDISHYLHADSPLVCSAAIRYLQQSHPESVLAEMHNLLNNPSNTVRRAAVRILDKCPGPDAADWLYRIIQNDSEGYIRATAAHILGKRGNPEDYNAILTLMINTETSGQPGIVAGLAACDGERAIADIMSQLTSTHEPARRAAIAALADLDPSQIPDLCRIAQEDTAASVRKVFVQKLGTIGGAQAAKMIRRFASDPSPFVREAVARSLKEIPYTVSAACLQSMLSDCSPIVRRCAYEALLNQKSHYL